MVCPGQPSFPPSQHQGHFSSATPVIAYPLTPHPLSLMITHSLAHCTLISVLLPPSPPTILTSTSSSHPYLLVYQLLCMISSLSFFLLSFLVYPFVLIHVPLIPIVLPYWLVESVLPVHPPSSVAAAAGVCREAIR